MRTIVITGNRNSGKTFLSKAISMGFENPAWIYAHHKSIMGDPFIFQSVDRETDVIIWKDVCPETIELVLSFVYRKEIEVERQCQKRFKMKRPVFVLDLSEEVDVEKHIIERAFLRQNTEIIVCQRPYPDDFRFKKFPASMFEPEKTLDHVKG